MKKVSFGAKEEILCVIEAERVRLAGTIPAAKPTISVAVRPLLLAGAAAHAAEDARADREGARR